MFGARIGTTVEYLAIYMRQILNDYVCICVFYWIYVADLLDFKNSQTLKF